METGKHNPDALLAIFAVIVSAVMITGVISYTTMIRASKDASEEDPAHNQLFLLGNLIGEGLNAENSIRAYRFTRDTIWLSEFYKHSINCSGILSKLAESNSNIPDFDPQISTLSVLYEQKLLNLEALSQLTDRTSVVSEVESISRTLDSETDRTKSGEKTLNILRNIFTPDRIGSSRKDSLYERVTSEVAKVKRKQSSKLIGLDSLEMNFMMINSAITSQIDSIVSKMRTDALKMVELAAEESNRLHLQVNRRIRLFSIAAILFMLVGGIAVYRYIRKRMQYETALLQARHNAETYSAMQERFVADMSHEVRTPLHAVAGFTEQLFPDTDPGKQSEYISLIKSAMRHLLQVVDDILDYSKLKAGKMKLKLQPFSPADEAATVSSIFQKEIVSKKIDYSFTNNLPPNFRMIGDALRFRQVLINLLGNAVKFTDIGSVSLKLFIVNTSDTRSHIEIVVADTGIGMTKEQQGKVFIPFEQAENKSLKNFQGTGLGLTITREIIEQQGGSISMKSHFGKGTTIIAKLPFIEAENEIIDEKSDAVKTKISLAGKMILVADDEEWNRRLIGTVLSKYNADLTIVNDGSSALQKLLNEHFDLALLDLRMPGKSGHEVAQSVRSSGKNSAIPIIAVTAQAGTTADFNNIDDVLIKPFTEEELLQKIAAVLKIYPYDISNVSNDDQLKKRGLIFDLTGLEAVGGGDAQFINEMVSIFLRNSLNSIKEIEDALKIGDKETIARHTHKLAPPVRQMRAEKVLALIKTLEDDASSGKPEIILKSVFEKLKVEMKILTDELKKYYPESKSYI